MSKEIIMGMFDDIRCKYILPVAGANEFMYQTKDTPSQILDLYEIREDGTLWVEGYDIEDRSPRTKWLAENPGKELPEDLKGLMGMSGMGTKVNKHWEQVPFTGEIRFYTSLGTDHSGWIEWSSYFVDGKIQQLHLIENKPPRKHENTNAGRD